MPAFRSLGFILLTLLLGAPALPAALPRLKVSDNKRFLVHEDGTPFFWLGDTAWELFHRATREEAERYLKDRAAKKFTLVQAVVLAEFDGLNAPNAYGHTPLKDNDPTRPNEEYFAHVDWIVAKAESLGLYVGMLPTWGDKVGPRLWGVGPEVFTPTNAEVYGTYLGKRYRDRALVWILGGDRNPDKPDQLAIWRALARGLRTGDGGRHLITYHPSGSSTSSTWFHDDKDFDVNLQQNGHNADVPVWERIGRDYARKPIKPVLDGEPLYEDHPIAFNARERGYSNAADVRKFAYWSIFAGACGHTYGHHSIWQFYDPKTRKPVNGPLMPWYQAIDRPGGRQMQHLRALLESRPVLSRIPDQSVLASDPSGGAKHLQATRDAERSYALVYTPTSRAFTVDLGKVRGREVQAWWFNPRTGAVTSLGTEVNAKQKKEFAPPEEGENLDWVLVVDDAAAHFGLPGQSKAKR